ncbi:hypothetical protein CEXT_715591 [Caerostris extrusa]|uniref:Uncharacterized protein n=1 Tax=Caerostris extrusa TaxID=172846 RepID=A0AAV4M7D1_CAEEX|nr:hypothetical protein CEXT_715591 [Caerostris extrusa]
MNGLVKKKKKKKVHGTMGILPRRKTKVPQTTPRKRGRKIKQDARMGTLPDIGFPKGKSISQEQVSHLSGDLWMKGFAENSELFVFVGEELYQSVPWLGKEKFGRDKTKFGV